MYVCVCVCRRSLERHNLIHTGAKPYSCLECGASFRRSENLVSHRNIHSDRPFSCQYGDCNAKYSSESVLQQHMRTHSKKKIEKQCKYCLLPFASSLGLSRHIRECHKNETAITLDTDSKWDIKLSTTSIKQNIKQEIKQESKQDEINGDSIGGISSNVNKKDDCTRRMKKVQPKPGPLQRENKNNTKKKGRKSKREVAVNNANMPEFEDNYKPVTQSYSSDQLHQFHHSSIKVEESEKAFHNAMECDPSPNLNQK
eukprot:Awhi_evm1s9500